MGLSIGYRLRLPAATRGATVRKRLAAVAHEALRLGCPGVRGLSPSDPESQLGYHPMTPRKRLIWVAPVAGWQFEVEIGEGCEPLRLGLFRHPRKVRLGSGEWIETNVPRGWHFEGWCKTQYAARHGWDHFLHCHRTVLRLLASLRRRGVEVSITDDGEYWPEGDEARLCAKLGEFDALVAGWVGLLKDRAEESGWGEPVTAPILRRDDFERLEHAGRMALGAPAAAAFGGRSEA